MFVTSSTFGGALGGLPGADQSCQTAAGNAQLGGTWVAWLSDADLNAADRITSDGPWRRMDDQLVAPSKADLLSGALAAPIHIDEVGEPLGALVRVWTGSGSSGTGSGLHCSNWTSDTNEMAMIGDASEQNSRWTEAGAEACNVAARLYCFEL